MIQTISKYKRLDWTIISLMFVFIHLIPSYSYSSENDSIARQKIIKLIADGVHYLNDAQYDSAIHLLEKADSLSILHESLELQANCQYNLGVTCYRKGDYINSGVFFESALDLISQTDDRLSYAKYILGIGILHKKKGDYKKASDFVLKAIKILEITENKLFSASAYNTMAGIQYKMQNDSIALKYYHFAISNYQKLNDSSSIASIYNNIGNLYLERDQYSKALSFLKQSFVLQNQLNEIRSLSITANTLGKLYLNIQQFDSAYYYIKIAFNNGLKPNNSIHFVESCHLLTKYFLKQNTDSALYYITLAQPIILKNDLKDLLLTNYQLNSVIYEQLMDYKTSLKYSRLYDSLHKKVLSVDMAQSINNLQFQYETEKKDIEIANLYEVNRLKTESIKTRNTGLFVISLLLLVSILLMTLLYRAYQQKTKANKKIRFLMHEKQHRTKNNLQLLSSVLSMQSLYSQQEEKDISLEVENRVQSIVLLDRLLYEANIEGDQIEIGQYLNELIIGLSEAYELKRKIEIIKDISPLLIPAEQAKFIGLLVNEMITNSFKYAFPKNENPKLEISFLPYEENNYQLILRDNGPGLPENKSNKKTSSLGMKLIDTMSRQLKGKYLIENRNGFYYELVFQVKKGLN